jgi:hypothetical protein
VTQKWLQDQYGSSTELSDSRYTILDGLGVIEQGDDVNGSDPGYRFKQAADMPTLSGDDLRAMGFALLSLNTDD